MEIPFGGISIILDGDVAQLPPVMDKVLYHRKPIDGIETAGFTAYMSFQTVVKLSVNERAKGESQNQVKFRTALLNLRNGISTKNDWNLFCSRTQSSLGFISRKSDYVKLSFSNNSVASNNYEALKRLGNPLALINARHNNKEAAKICSDEMGGLESKLLLCVGSKVMLTRNLWINKGLCNGSIGVVKDIIFDINQGPPSLPIGVIVQFNGYSGPSFCQDMVDCVPIVLVINAIDDHVGQYERQQLPLKLAWAITIHKSQGLTLPKAWVDVGNKESFDGLSYVDLSRVKQLADLIVEPFTFERLQKVSSSKSFQFRKAEENRLDELARKTATSLED